jgi:hypothetical protein
MPPRPPISKARPWTPSRGPFAGRTFTTEREYRNALARQQGLRSWYQQQRTPRRVRRSEELQRLRPSEQEARRAALEAVALMRREGFSLGEAAARAGTTTAAIVRHAGPALEREQGRYQAKRCDRLLRVMTVLGEGGVERLVEVRSSRQASLVSEHWHALDDYRNKGDETGLRALRGKTVAGIPLETDPDRIDEWERRGELEIDDIYDLTG